MEKLKICVCFRKVRAYRSGILMQYYGAQTQNPSRKTEHRWILADWCLSEREIESQRGAS